MSRAREEAVDEVLSGLAGGTPALSAAVVSRGGAVFGGKLPAGADRESYGAMMAVLHGAAETGTAGLGGEVAEVQVRLREGAVVVVAAGAKMLLVAHFADPEQAERARPGMGEAARRLAALL